MPVERTEPAAPRTDPGLLVGPEPEVSLSEYPEARGAVGPDQRRAVEGEPAHSVSPPLHILVESIARSLAERYSMYRTRFLTTDERLPTSDCRDCRRETPRSPYAIGRDRGQYGLDGLARERFGCHRVRLGPANPLHGVTLDDNFLKQKGAQSIPRRPAAPHARRRMGERHKDVIGPDIGHVHRLPRGTPPITAVAAPLVIAGGKMQVWIIGPRQLPRASADEPSERPEFTIVSSAKCAAAQNISTSRAVYTSAISSLQ